MKLLSRVYVVLLGFLTDSRSLSFSGAALDSRAAAANNARWGSKSGGGGDDGDRGVKIEAGGGRGRESGEGVSLSDPQLKLLAFDEDYDFNLPPAAEDGGPLNVDVSLNLRNILQVNEITQIVTMEVSVRLHWMDKRVRLKNESLIPEDEEYLTLNPRLARYLWVPDLFIDQAKEMREPTFHVLPASLRVYRNGMLRYAARVNFDVACDMDFRAYPGDRQICEVKFESFGYSTRQLHFRWSNQTSHVNENISLAQFELEVSMKSSYDTDYYDVKYPGLILKLAMSRKLNYHLVQSYIPSAVYLTVSWLALFVPPQSVAERLAMAMTIMLTLTTMFASERQNVPRVSYITYLDVWMLTCVLFVFLELAEFTIVLHLIRSKHDRLVPAIERTAKLALPVLFLGFNAVYWSLVLFPRNF